LFLKLLLSTAEDLLWPSGKYMCIDVQAPHSRKTVITPNVSLTPPMITTVLVIVEKLADEVWLIVPSSVPTLRATQFRVYRYPPTRFAQLQKMQRRLQSRYR
jgi:hypothetical protein